MISIIFQGYSRTTRDMLHSNASSDKAVKEEMSLNLGFRLYPLGNVALCYDKLASSL